MNVPKVVGIILIVCGAGIILVGYALANGESNSNNIRTGVIGISMLALGFFQYFGKSRKST